MKKVRTLVALLLAASMAALSTSCDFKKLLGVDDTAPGPVSSLVATAGNGAVRLVWVDPGDGDFHHVAISVSPGGKTTLRGRGEAAALITDLVNGQAYTFAARAADESGNQSQAVSAAATPVDTGDSTPPAEVTNLSTTSSSTSVRLEWTDPTDGDLAFVEISVEPEASAPLIRAPGECRATVSGLSPGASYTFTVRSVDDSWNRSVGVAKLASTTTLSDAEAPDPVASLAAVAGDGLVNLTWLDPADSDLNLIEIRISPSDRIVVVDKATQKARIAGLTDAQEYTFSALAVDRSGNRSSAVEIKATPAEMTDTTAPAITKIWTVPLEPKANSPFRIEVSYEEPESEVTLSYDTDGDEVFDDAASLTPTATGSLTVKVQVTNADGLSATQSLAVLVASAGLYPGDYTIDSADTATDIAGLAAYSGINGSLNIVGTSLTSLAGLEHLTEVRGTLLIDDCPFLADISALGSITHIGGSLCLGYWGAYSPYNNLNLPVIDLDGLHVASIDGDLILHGLGCATLSGASGGLQSLARVGGSILVEGCAYLVDLHELAGVTGTLTGNIGSGRNICPDGRLVDCTLAIFGNPAFTDLSGLGGVVCDGLYLQGNDALQSTTGLGGVRARNGYDIDIRGNPSLTSLAGLSQVGRATGDLRIEDNDALTTLAGLGVSYSVGAELYIVNNEKLAGLGALSTIANVGGNLSICGNGTADGGLASLAGLEALRFVAGSLSLNDNPYLADTSALSLSSVGGDFSVCNDDRLASFSNVSLDTTKVEMIQGSLVIAHNQDLASLAGLEIDRINNGIFIRDDLSLADCSALDYTSAIDNNLRFLVVSGCPALPNLTGLGGFTTIQGGVAIPESFSYAVEVSNNDSLASVSTLGGLTLLSGDFLLYGNLGLSSLAGLSNLSITNGSLHIGYSGAGTYLTSLDGLSGFAIASGSLEIANNPFLASVSALSTFAAGSYLLDFSIVNCDSLPSLSGLESLHDVRRLTLNGNAILSSIAALGDNANGSTINPDAVYIVDCPSLASLAGLEGLTDLPYNLQLAGLPELTSLSGLANLVTMGGWLAINDCDKLASIDLSKLTTIGNSVGLDYSPYVYVSSSIQGCDQLVNLAGTGALAVLANVTHTGYGRISISGNTVLSQAEIDALGAQIGGY